MFTGIIRCMGRLSYLERTVEHARIRVTSDGLELAEGESIAVDGVCLTALEVAPGSFEADLSGETLDKTCLGDRGPEDPVNLETCLRAQDGLGGHFVLGHIDSCGHVEKLLRREGDAELVVNFPVGYDRYIVPKGSVAVNGVSLTVAHSTKTSFGIALIPYTLEVTNLGNLEAGDRVNLEYDYLAKAVCTYLEARDDANGPG